MRGNLSDISTKQLAMSPKQGYFSEISTKYLVKLPK